ncbi:MAG: hypothetical protein ACYDEF_00320 [Methanosarcina sp.]
MLAFVYTKAHARYSFQKEGKKKVLRSKTPFRKIEKKGKVFDIASRKWER